MEYINEGGDISIYIYRYICIVVVIKLKWCAVLAQ